MERPLTSWKEIALHFNKSVRTVQRWEQQFGLPVRRPDAHDHGIVLAFPTELDTWLRNHLVVRNEAGTQLQTLGPAVATDSAALSEYVLLRDRSLVLTAKARTLVERVKQNSERLREIMELSRVLHQTYGQKSRRAPAEVTPRPPATRRERMSQSAAQAS